MAAEQGEPAAQYNLGLKYANGLGVDQDAEQAIKWYTLAAEQNYALAQLNFGVMYATGNGVPKDYRMAYMWFDISSQNGNEGAAKNKKQAATLLSSEQIAEAKKMAEEWLKLHKS